MITTFSVKLITQSIGGGFIVDEEHFDQQTSTNKAVPYCYNSAAELLLHCKKTGLSVSNLVMKNELALHTKEKIDHYFANIRHTMQTCIERGLNTEVILPGPLRVPRRAAALHRMLTASQKLSNDCMDIVDLINMFALAVNEENAAARRNGTH